MKNIRRLLCLSCLGLSLGLSGCSHNELRLHGHMETIEHQGEKCWIFVDDNHHSYEVITPSHDILKENLHMRIKAMEVNRKTLCDLPTVIDIYEYRPDFAKDM